MNTSQIHLDYPEKTMFQMVERNSKDYPNAPAYELYGNKTTYAEFVKNILQME